jgi:hypothetical protein
MERAFEKLHIPFLINQLFCFTCGTYYKWTSRNQPDRCARGQHEWTTKGEYARPDFILLGDKQIGIVRVDGGIHDVKKHVIADAWQVRNFHRNGARVFIVRNEHIDGFEPNKEHKRKKPAYLPAKVPDYVIMGIAWFFWSALNDDKLYQLYLNDKESSIWLGLH